MNPFLNSFLKLGPRPPSVIAAEQVFLALLLAASLSLFVAQGYRVSGDCMQPHLYTGERILVSKLAYTIQGPQRGDVVVFLYPRDPRQTFVKRVIGLPGDTIAIQAGRVFIDGRLLPEPYRVNPAHGDKAPTALISSWATTGTSPTTAAFGATCPAGIW